MTPGQVRTRALLMLVLATAFWGLSFPVIKAILLLHDERVPGAGSWFATINTVAPRFLLATLVLVAWRPRALGRITGPEWKQGVVIGVFAAAGMLFQNDGLQFTSASTSAFLTQFYAILIPVWLALRHRRDPGLRVWICCALVLAGVAVLGKFNPFAQFRGGWQSLGRGEWETLLSSLFFMGQILWLEKKEFATNRAGAITLVMFATQAVIFYGLALAVAPRPAMVWAPWTSGAWLGLTLVLTVVCTIGAYSLMNAWQPKITATEAGLVYCVEPIFGSILACFLPAMLSRWAGVDYPNETATWTLLVGGGLITGANVLLQIRPSTEGTKREAVSF